MFSSSLLETKFKKIKLLGLDVDGVLTDGKIWLLPDGQELKCFHILDGLGLKQVQKAGIIIAIITGRTSTALTERMKELNIAHVYQGCQDKLKTMQELCKQLKLSLEQVAYMGDDLPDSELMKQVGLKLTVPNAVSEIKNLADYCTILKGGEGAVREVCDLILLKQPLSL